MGDSPPRATDPQRGEGPDTPWRIHVSDGLSGLPLTTRILVLLTPGISLKRWLIIGGLGLGAICLGVLLALQVPLGSGLDSLAGALGPRGTHSLLRGGICIVVGTVLTALAAYMLNRTLSNARSRRRHRAFIDSIYIDRVLSTGPKIVAIGGGSGLPNLLRGLKHYTTNITAVVTVADDGGSSGRLRSEMDMPPPGDIRNCLVALADPLYQSGAVMQELMDYRFSTNGQLDGHSFGNILIAALADIEGGFYKGVETAGQLLRIRGKVVPSTSSNVTLVGRTVSGQRLVGETEVGSTKEHLRMVSLDPHCAPPHPDAVQAIAEADLLILGPGSLFTSVVPNLLVSGIASAVEDTGALKMFVCNVADQPGETDGFTIPDYVEVIRHYAGHASIDAVVANSNLLDAEREAAFKLVRPEAVWNDSAEYVLADVISENRPTRHDPAKLAQAIIRAYSRNRGSRTRLPRSLYHPLPGHWELSAPSARVGPA